MDELSGNEKVNAVRGIASGEFERLRGLMRALRGEHGCPWDRRQTLESLIRHLREESGELIEAIGEGDAAHIREEFGDTMMVLVMMLEVAEESGLLTFDAAMRGINEKLVRRHPHVFGDETYTTEEEILDNWKRIKQEEKKNRVQT